MKNEKKKMNGDTVAQLTALKEWSQNPESYYKKEQAKKVAGIKDSSLYKLLKNPKVIGVDLGHDTIMEVINLIQNSGLVKKPKVQPKKDDDKQLIRWALEESPVPIVKNPVLKKAINDQQLEEKIRRFAQAKQNNIEQVGVASLLGIPKRFSR